MGVINTIEGPALGLGIRRSCVLVENRLLVPVPKGHPFFRAGVPLVFFWIFCWFFYFFLNFKSLNYFENFISNHPYSHVKVHTFRSVIISNFPADHPSSHCSSPSTLNFPVPSPPAAKSAIVVFLTIISYQSY